MSRFQASYSGAMVQQNIYQSGRLEVGIKLCPCLNGRCLNGDRVVFIGYIIAPQEKVISVTTGLLAVSAIKTSQFNR